MYAFLLVSGAAITAVGLAVVATGVSVQEHAFDPGNVTPGTIAVIGGFILIGLGFVVRALLRVERALRARPMPRPARPGEAPHVAVPTERTTRIPFPPKPKPAPHPQAVPAAAATAFEGLQEKFPTVVRENPPMVEDAAVSLSPKVLARSEENGEDNTGHAACRANGAAAPAAPAGTAPQVETEGRSLRGPERARTSIFDSFWPKAQRPTSEALKRPAAPPAPAAPPPASPSANGGAPPPIAQPAAAPQEEPAPISILKSGVVEGMAYTLYSDGSIEAQLPQGTLRFGSITDLRNHIEQNS